MTLSVADIAFRPHVVGAIQQELLQNRKQFDRFKYYGKNAIDPEQVRSSFDLNTQEQVEHTTRFILKSWEYASYVVRHPELIVGLVNGTDSYLQIKHAGIDVKWRRNDFVSWFGIREEAIQRTLDGIASKVDPADYGHRSSKTLWLFNDPKLSHDYVGAPDRSMLYRAFAQARRNLMIAASNGYTDISEVKHTHTGAGALGVIFWSSDFAAPGDLYTYGNYSVAKQIREAYYAKIDVATIRSYRQEVLEAQSRKINSDAFQRRQIAADNFDKYWNNLKQRIREVAPAKWSNLDNEFAELVPLQPAGTPASRTWGIEVETIRAEHCTRPAGWKRESDGSLDGASCACDCDSCYDGDHCDDTDECSESEAAEFVSPVLDSFNSSGLRQLCTEISDAGYMYETNTSPGLHVHVDAGDLSVTDIARLVMAYSAVSPLLEPLYHRETRGYCKDTTTHNVRWWLSQSRDYLRTNGHMPAPRDLVYNQPDDRYTDINLQAIAKHGTVEFRAMGPIYSYDHLVRWAWLVREMVNVSKLGIHQTEWTSCRSLADVVSLLRKYGTEMPTDKLFDKLNTRVLDLSAEEINEADGE